MKRTYRTLLSPARCGAAGLVMLCFSSGCAVVNGLLNTTLQLLQLGLQLAPMLLLVSVGDPQQPRTIPVEIPVEALDGTDPSFEFELVTRGHRIRLSDLRPGSHGLSARVEIERDQHPPWTERIFLPLDRPFATNLTASVRMATRGPISPGTTGWDAQPAGGPG